MLPSTRIMVFLHLSWSEFVCYLETGITLIKGVPTIVASFWKSTPWTDVGKLSITYLPQIQAPTVPTLLVENIQLT